jgi:hypothetical protein
MRAAESSDDRRERTGIVPGRQKVLALQVRGSGMADEGLRDGDRLIVERRSKAADGQTVVAEVDGKLTVKRVFRDARGRIRLRPANPEMLPLAVSPSRHRIIGVLVGISRRQSVGGGRPERPHTDTAERTLDLPTHVIDQSLGQAEHMAAARSGVARARLQELAQSLRTLRDCYLDARTPKLRAALLREAGAVVRRMRRFDGERPQDPALSLA